MWFITRILSKADGVPPLWTWPRMVVRVSKPSFFETSCKGSLSEKINSKRATCTDSCCFDFTDLLDFFTCNRFTAAVCRSLGNNNDVQAGAAASLLEMTGKGLNPCVFFFRLKPADQYSPTARLLHLGVSCTDAPPTPHLEASLEWTPSRLHRPEPSPKRGIFCWKDSLTQNTFVFFKKG